MTEAWQEVERITQTALKEGLDKGREEGHKEGEEQLRLAIEDLAEAYGVKLTLGQRRSLRGMKLEELRVLRQHLKAHRRWPT